MKKRARSRKKDLPGDLRLTKAQQSQRETERQIDAVHFGLAMKTREDTSKTEEEDGGDKGKETKKVTSLQEEFVEFKYYYCTSSCIRVHSPASRDF